jgi:hypothetical protein
LRAKGAIFYGLKTTGNGKTPNPLSRWLGQIQHGKQRKIAPSRTQESAIRGEYRSPPPSGENGLDMISLTPIIGGVLLKEVSHV